MTFLLFAVEGVPDPVPPLGKLIGSVLGALIVVVGIVLVLRHRSASRNEDEEVNLAVSLRWRTPTALLMAAMGALVVVGVWVDAGMMPRVFVGVWGAVLILLTSTLLLAGYDLLQVRRVGRRHGLALLEENRRRLEQDVAEYHSRRSPPSPGANGTNGAHKH